MISMGLNLQVDKLKPIPCFDWLTKWAHPVHMGFPGLFLQEKISSFLTVIMTPLLNFRDGGILNT